MNHAFLFKKITLASAISMAYALSTPALAQNSAAYTPDPTSTTLGCGTASVTCYGPVTMMAPNYSAKLKTCGDATCSSNLVTDRTGISAAPLTLAQTSLDTFKAMQTAQYNANKQPSYILDSLGTCNVISTTGDYDCRVYGKRYLSGSGASAVYSGIELLSVGVNISVLKRNTAAMCNGYIPSLGCPNTTSTGVNSANSLSGQTCSTNPMNEAMVSQCLSNPGVGNPINVVTGAKIETKTDLVWPILFSRTYTSDRPTSFSMGAWRHNHDSRLYITQSPYSPSFVMALQFSLENDESIVFVRTSSAAEFTQTSVDQKAYRLEVNANGFLLTLPDGEKRQYASDGSMTSRTMRNGYQYLYSYDTAGRMIQILDSYQRGLSLSYTGSSTFLDSVTSVGVASTAIDTVSYNYVNLLLSAATFNLTETTSYLYTAGRLTGVKDPLNNQYASFTYQADGKATQSKHIADTVSVNQVDMTYATNSITATQNGASNVYTMARDTYTAKNRITSAKLGGTLSNYSISYNNNGQAYRLTAGTLVNTYDISLTTMLPNSRTREDGQEITYTWDNDLRVMTSITEPSPEGTRTTSYGYNNEGLVVSKSVLSGSGETRSQAWSYGTYGKPESATAVDGSITSYDYYSDTDSSPELRGQLKKITNALGQTIEITAYDVRGNPTTMEDENNIQTTFTYDTRGRELTRTRGGSSVTKTYDLAGQLLSATYSNGVTLTYAYDTAHRLKSIISSTGEKALYTYDAYSNITQTNVYKGTVLEQTLNRTFTPLWQLKSAWASTTTEANSLTYNTNGAIATRVDGLNRTTTYGYDSMGNLRTKAEPGMSSTLLRDLDGNLNSYAGGSVTTTTYGWNDFQELLTITSPDSKNQTLTHNASSRTDTMTDNAGILHSLTRDSLGRVTESKHEKAGSSTITETMTYDSGSYAQGRISSANNGTANQIWTWNSQSLVESKTQTVAGVTLALNYAYDTQGQLTGITYPSGMAVTYAWSNGRISSVSVNGQLLISNIIYRASNNDPIGWSWSNGTTYSKSYDANGKVSGVNDSGVITQTTAFDGALRLTSLTDTAGGSFTLTPTYATGNQIASVNAGGVSSSYTFDSNWNRTKRTTPSLIDTISMTTQTNLPYQVVTNPGATKPISYDLNNNVVNNGRGTFLYDLKNNLAQATVSSVVTNYGYDRNSRRVLKTTGTNQSFFIYDELGNLSGEYGNAGSLTAEHIYLGRLPIGVNAGGSVKSVHTDYLGTPRVVTSGSSIVWKWDATDPFGSNAPSVSTLTYNLRFAGQFFDAETGLHDNHYRTYDPLMGRYMQPDPIGLAAGKNPFNYVNQNPLNGTDRDGLLQLDKMKAVGKVNRDGIEFMKLEIPTDYDPSITVVAYQMIGKELRPGEDHRRDCHGVTFGQGQFIWINNDQVDNILKGDRYEQVLRKDAREGDAVLYRQFDTGEVQHSVRVFSIKDANILVVGKGGTQPESFIKKPQAVDDAWKGSEISIEFWRQNP